MSDKTDSLQLESDTNTVASSSTPSGTAVSNGIVTESLDTTSTRTKIRKSSRDSDSASIMTNKDVPSPSQRTRLRSRSKSNNSEDLKLEKPSEELPSAHVETSLPSIESNASSTVPIVPANEVTEDPTPEKKIETDKSTNLEELETKSTTKSKRRKSKSDETDLKTDESEPNTETVVDMSNEVPEVNKEEEVEPVEETKDSSQPEETTTPMDVDEDNSSDSDFAGFNEPEDKYSAFSIVFKPFQEPEKIVKPGSTNGPLDPIVKISTRLSYLRSSPSAKVDITDPEFKKPFALGWRREVVFRNTSDNGKKNSDVYYFTPNNKKVRSIREVLEHLTPGGGLGAANFTFSKEVLGVDDPEKEIIREASYKPVRSSVKANSKKGKASPKPKEKKEVVKETAMELSPTSTAGTSKGSRLSPLSLTPRLVMKSFASRKAVPKKTPKKTEKKRKGSGPDDSAAVDGMEDWCPVEPKAQSNGLKRSAGDTGSGSDGSPPAKMSAVSPKSMPTVKAIGLPKQAPKVSPAPKQSGAKSPAQPLTTSVSAVVQTRDFMNLFNAGFIGLLNAFQYLKVHELLRAACVCKTWRHLATHRSLWETVKMKNSRVRNWDGFGKSLRNNSTRCLDLKKMLVPEGSEAVAEMWKNMISALKTVPTLTKIDLGRCTPENLEMVTKACPQLESIVALSIRGVSLDLSIFKGDKLVELRLKSVGGMDVTNFSALTKLTKLKHLSLTSVKKLLGLEHCLPVSLETLELGECCQMHESFASETLPLMKNLTRLRLEKGQGKFCPTTQLISAISGLEKLTQLELINFDIKPGFDKALAKCVHIKTLLIIPTYVTQSATTNHVVMGGVSKLAPTLDYFIWGLTLELLRVTDLFIDQVEGQKQKIFTTQVQAKKGSGDSIPILKPLSDETAETSREGQTTSQVDILALPKLQKVLSTLLPTTRVKILKVPFSATWRQIVD